MGIVVVSLLGAGSSSLAHGATEEITMLSAAEVQSTDGGCNDAGDCGPKLLGIGGLSAFGLSECKKPKVKGRCPCTCAQHIVKHPKAMPKQKKAFKKKNGLARPARKPIRSVRKARRVVKKVVKRAKKVVRKHKRRVGKLKRKIIRHKARKKSRK